MLYTTQAYVITLLIWTSILSVYDNTYSLKWAWNRHQKDNLTMRLNLCPYVHVIVV